MTTTIDRMLGAAAEAAFEQLGFLMVDPDAPEDAEPGPMHGMVVRYQGPVRGALLVRGDEALLTTLAENMLGADEAPPLPLQLDALGEIANVICGNVLPETDDPQAVFRLDSPVRTDAAGAGDGERERGSVRLHLDTGIADVMLLESVS